MHIDILVLGVELFDARYLVICDLCTLYILFSNSLLEIYMFPVYICFPPTFSYPLSSLLCIETADRPGLLLEIIKILADIYVNVESAEIDSEVCLHPTYLKTPIITFQYNLLMIFFQGLIAKDAFHVSYRDSALNDSLSQVITEVFKCSLGSYHVLW